MLTGKTAPVSNVPGRPQKRTPKKQQQTTREPASSTICEGGGACH